MWKCQKCGTENRDDRDNCWSCSTTKGAYQPEAKGEYDTATNNTLSTNQSVEENKISDLPPSVPLSSPEYIMYLERKIIQLENQVQQVEKQLTTQNSSVNSLASRIPNTSLISPNFTTRAFAVWGHYFVAQLMIAIPIYCIIFALSMLSSNGR